MNSEQIVLDGPNDIGICVVGIDPGLKGGIAVIDFNSDIAAVWPMPLTTNNRDKPIIDVNRLQEHIAYFSDWSHTSCQHVYIEEVSSMSGQGVTSVFTFGKGYGMLLGAFQVLNYDIRLVRPQEWKKKILPNTDKDKQSAINHCKTVFPDISLLPTSRSRKDSDGLADALCIAMYGVQSLHEYYARLSEEHDPPDIPKKPRRKKK